MAQRHPLKLREHAQATAEQQDIDIGSFDPVFDGVELRFVASGEELHAGGDVACFKDGFDGGLSLEFHVREGGGDEHLEFSDHSIPRVSAG